MQQLSQVPFGTDATVLAGYAQAANDRLGNIDFVFENTGDVAAYIRVKEYDGTTSPSGYTDVTAAKGWLESSPNIAQFTVAARGTLTKSFSLVSKVVGFFGSGVGGSTKVCISSVIRNRADLRGADISIVAGGRKGWGFDNAYNRKSTQKSWGMPPDQSGNTESDGYGGTK